MVPGAYRFRDVVVESLAHELPPEVVTSAELEARLAPLYERLRLPAGRLELMTGIRERRFWPVDFRPSAAAAAAGRRALEASCLGPESVDLLVHCAVCRDMLEPSTASFVHRELGLPEHTQVFDLSNACLGFLNALTVAGAMIDAGQVRVALLVAGENGRPLVEETVARLLDGTLDRQGIKPYFANLTIGAGAVAAVVCHRDLAPGAHRLVGGASRAATRHNELCQGDAVSQHGLHMQTDSEALLVAGIETARATWGDFVAVTGWAPADLDRVVTHQVGVAHHRALFTALGLDPARSPSTFATLGNVGSVSCPLTLSDAVAAGRVERGHRVGLLGIGSGINCLMLAVEW